MTNREVINKINSLYVIPTDEQIEKFIKITGNKYTVEFIKQNWFK